MKTPRQKPHNLCHNVVNQTLSIEPFRDKAEGGSVPLTYQSKYPQKPGQNSCFAQIYTIDRRKDNTLYCRETGQKIPSTPEGKLDKNQLAIEILHKRLIGFDF